MLILTFEEFNNKFNIDNNAMSDIRIKDIGKDISLTPIEIGMRDQTPDSIRDPNFNIILNLHPTEGTHWVLGIRREGGPTYYFDTFGVETPPLCLEEYVDLGSNEKIQQYDESYCGAYCLYMIYLFDRGFRIKSALNILVNQCKYPGIYNECSCLSCSRGGDKDKDNVNDKVNDLRSSFANNDNDNVNDLRSSFANNDNVNDKDNVIDNDNDNDYDLRSSFANNDNVIDNDNDLRSSFANNDNDNDNDNDNLNDNVNDNVNDNDNDNDNVNDNDNDNDNDRDNFIYLFKEKYQRSKSNRNSNSNSISNSPTNNIREAVQQSCLFNHERSSFANSRISVNTDDDLYSWLNHDNIVTEAAFPDNFRCIISSPSECVKTFLLKKLILASIYFDKLYIWDLLVISTMV